MWMTLAIFCIVAYFSFFLFLIYSIITLINLFHEHSFKGPLSFWAVSRNGLAYPSHNRTINQYWGEVGLDMIGGLGFAFIVYCMILMIPDFFDRSNSLKIVHDIFFSGFCGLGFYFFLKERGLSGSLITEVNLRRTIDVQNTECEILIETLIKNLDTSLNLEDELERTVSKIRDKSEGSGSVNSLLTASESNLKERLENYRRRSLSPFVD